jgi:hypothetical protein
MTGNSEDQTIVTGLLSRPIPKRLTVCTAVATIVCFRWSAQRFELDTYHGDALPTELRGLSNLGLRTSARLLRPAQCWYDVESSALATNVHRHGYAALGFGRPQRCWRSLRMRARSRRWAARTPRWRAWALRQRR